MSHTNRNILTITQKLTAAETFPEYDLKTHWRQKKTTNESNERYMYMYVLYTTMYIHLKTKSQ